MAWYNFWQNKQADEEKLNPAQNIIARNEGMTIDTREFPDNYRRQYESLEIVNRGVNMIVDDTAENIKVLGTILRGNDYEIYVARDGAQALEVVEKYSPDLILLDVNMPELNGFETCKQLKKNDLSKCIPIIFLTARADTEDIVKGLGLGAVDYITKPFQEKELMIRVETHLDLKFSKEEFKLDAES